MSKLVTNNGAEKAYVARRPSNPSLSPQEYAEIICRHAKRDTHQSLFSGQSFEDLAQRLENFHYQAQRDDAARYLPKDLSLASLCTINASGRNTVQLTDTQQCRQLLEATPEAIDSHILFLRGNPSSEWLTTVGSICQVEPEYLQRHLSFQSPSTYFSLPSLPSCSENIIRLPFVTLCSREDKVGKSDQNIIDEMRVKGTKAMEVYTHRLKMDALIGDSIVRQYFVHDERHFSLEQEMTISLNQVSDHWIALIALDVGKDLGESLDGPWNLDYNSMWKIRVYPTIQHRPGIVLQSDDLAIPYKDNKIGVFPQSASLLHQDYGRLLNSDIMRRDPFYALHELFAFCASSELQFLNMMDSKISSETGYAMFHSAPTLSNLLYHQEILESHEKRLLNIIEIIRRRGSPDWPRLLNTEEYQISEKSAEKLERDYGQLLHCVQSLHNRCEKGMRIVLGKASIREAELALQQSRRVGKLTQLAFFYIPFSFMTSFFGMNVSEFGTGRLQIWLCIRPARPAQDWFDKTAETAPNISLYIYLDEHGNGSLISWEPFVPAPHYNLLLPIPFRQIDIFKSQVQSSAILTMSAINTNERLEKKLSPTANNDGENAPRLSVPVGGIYSAGFSKAQPWKRIWPNAKPAGVQMPVYGFKKGEVMEILGNAGNFFAHGDWEIEHDTSKYTDSSANDNAVRKPKNLRHSVLADSLE